MITQLGYAGFYSSAPGRWRQLADALGAELAEVDSTVFGLRLDSDRVARVFVHAADADGLAYAGWEVPDPAVFRLVLDRLRKCGKDFELRPDLAKVRCVEEIAVFVDPDGNPMELYWGMSTAMRTQFISARGVEFVTGDMGMGHLTFAVRNFRETMEFYTEVLGMRVTEIADVAGARVGFLRCNARHHSIAFTQLPSGNSRLMHVAVEVAEMDALGSIRDVLLDVRFPIKRDLGRHPTDGVISLYAGVADGFDFELGCGSIVVDDQTWEHDRYARKSWSWGHREPLDASTTRLGETESRC